MCPGKGKVASITQTKFGDTQMILADFGGGFASTAHSSITTMLMD
jgi:hypothetical protein